MVVTSFGRLLDRSVKLTLLLYRACLSNDAISALAPGARQRFDMTGRRPDAHPSIVDCVIPVISSIVDMHMPLLRFADTAQRFVELWP